MFIDLTRTIETAMPTYPGDSPTVLKQSQTIATSGCNNHYLRTGMHTGTHIDVPLHFFDSGIAIDGWPLAQFLGRGIWLDCSKIMAGGIIKYDAACEKLIAPDSIVVCHTGWSAFFNDKSYFTSHPVLSPEYADLFIAKKIKMLCLDSPSPDYPPFPVHRKLLGNSVLIAENLCNTSQLSGIQSFEIIALPLKIAAAGSIARIIARVL